MKVWKGCSKSFANKYIAHYSYNYKSIEKLLLFFTPYRLVLSSVELKKKITYFLIWKGGSGVLPPENFEYQISRRSHLWSFCKDNFTFS